MNEDLLPTKLVLSFLQLEHLVVDLVFLYRTLCQANTHYTSTINKIKSLSKGNDFPIFKIVLFLSNSFNFSLKFQRFILSSLSRRIPSAHYCLCIESQFHLYSIIMISVSESFQIIGLWIRRYVNLFTLSPTSYSRRFKSFFLCLVHWERF